MFLIKIAILLSKNKTTWCYLWYISKHSCQGDTIKARVYLSPCLGCMKRVLRHGGGDTFGVKNENYNFTYLGVGSAKQQHKLKYFMLKCSRSIPLILLVHHFGKLYGKWERRFFKEQQILEVMRVFVAIVFTKYYKSQ